MDPGQESHGEGQVRAGKDTLVSQLIATTITGKVRS
jgi:hypothetical protein